MCRFAARLGPPRPLDALLYAAPHALAEQAHAPREQVHGTVNVDGTGVVWWTEEGATPLRYATTLPPWADDNLRELAPVLRARAAVAAVRGATPGMPGGRAAVAPFVVDGLAVAHNGWLGGFHDGVGARLLADLPASLLAQLDTATDSRVVALHLAAHRRSDDDLVSAVDATLRHVAHVARWFGRPATLNVLAADGRRIVASRAGVDAPHNSLHVRHDATAGEALVASEALDDGAWEPVPPDHLVEVTVGHCRTVRLDLGADR